MRAVLQRVHQARVKVESREIGSISHGMLVFLGVASDDTEEDLSLLSSKLIKFRIFADKDNKMNLSIRDTGGSMLIISQFTLFGTWRKGNRPGFFKAASPEKGETYYNHFIDLIKKQGIPVSTGTFGANMNVELSNDGPVTFFLDTRNPE